MSIPTCPNCRRGLTGKPGDWPFFPFCSRRCRLIDLGRWFDESYRIERPRDDGEDPDGSSDEGADVS